MNSSVERCLDVTEIDRHFCVVTPEMSISAALAESRCGVGDRRQRHYVLVGESDRISGYLCDDLIFQQLSQGHLPQTTLVRQATAPVCERRLADVASSGFDRQTFYLLRDANGKLFGIVPPSLRVPQSSPQPGKSAGQCCHRTLTLPRCSSLFQVARYFHHHPVSAVVLAEITSDESVIPTGLVTRNDLLQALHLDWETTTAREIASTPVFSIAAEASVESARRQLQQLSIHQLVVLDSYGAYQGLLCDRDLPPNSQFSETSHGTAYGSAPLTCSKDDNPCPILQPGLLELNLSESNARMRAFLDGMTELILVLNRNLQTVQVAPTNPQLLYDNAFSVLDRTVERLTEPEWRSQLIPTIERVLNSGQSTSYDYSLPLPGSNRQLWFAARISPMPDGETVLWVARDITARKQSEDNLRALVDSVRDYGIFRLDMNGNIVSWNLGAQRIQGYRPDEILGQHVSILFTEEDRQRREPERELRLAAQSGRYEGEGWRVCKDGSQFWAQISTTALYDDLHHLCGYTKITCDITERRIQEIWLRLLKQAISASRNGIVIADAKRRDYPIIYVNRGFETITGYHREEVIGRNCRFLQGRDRQQAALEEVRRALQEDRPTCVTLRNYRQDGTRFWNELTLSPVRDTNGSVSHYVGVQTDITALKDTEQRLCELNIQLQAILDAARDFAIITTDLNSTITIFNPGAETMLGYTAEEVVGRHSPLLFQDAQELQQQARTLVESPDEVRSPEDALKILTRHVVGGQTECQEWTFYRKDGSSLTVSLTVAPIRLERDVVGFLAIAQDISDRKATEIQLQRKSELLEKIIDSIPVSIAAYDADGALVFVNRHLEDTYGWTSEELNNIDLLAECYPDPKDLEAVRQSIREADGQWHDCHTQTRSGKKLYTTWANLRLSDGSHIGIGQDITQRKQAELETTRAKERLELVIQAANDGFWDWDFETNEIYFSPRWKEMLGYEDRELPNRLETWENLIFQEDYQEALQLIDDYNRDRGDRFQTIQRFHHKNGSIVYVLFRALHLKDANDNVIRMVGAHTDITPMLRVQQALKDSELQLTSILNSSLDGIMAFRSLRDDNGEIYDFEWLSINAAASTMVGRSAQDLLGKKLLVEMPGNRAEGLFEGYVQVVETGEPVEREFYYDRDGITCWFQNIAVKLGDGFAVTFRNITKLKQAEQKLQEANRQLEGRIAELKQRNQEMQILGEMNDFLQSCLTVEEAYRTVAALIPRLFPHCSGGIYSLYASRNWVEEVVTWGVPTEAKLFPAHDCWALRRGRVHWATKGDRDLFCSHSYQDNDTPSATFCIPTIAQGETLGLLSLWAESPAYLDETKRQLARTVAEQLALAVANLRLQEKLRHQSMRDGLTGLYNRRYMEEALEQNIQRARRHGQSLGAIMLDVDRFKGFNDTFGHEAGDLVLQAVAQVLQDNVRGSDIACRYGGEELIAILPEASLEETFQCATEIRVAISQLQLSHHGRPLDRITASFGVATFPQFGGNGAEVIQAADAALYRAKAAGRNCVVAAEHPQILGTESEDTSEGS